LNLRSKRQTASSSLFAETPPQSGALNQPSQDTVIFNSEGSAILGLLPEEETVRGFVRSRTLADE
jgi:hypothetical protein